MMNGTDTASRRGVSTKHPAWLVWLLRTSGIVASIPFLLGALVVILFFDNGTQLQLLTYLIGVIAACVGIGVTVASARTGRNVSLALLIWCVVLGVQYRDTLPEMVFGIFLFPVVLLTFIALILLATNLVVMQLREAG